MKPGVNVQTAFPLRRPSLRWKPFQGNTARHPSLSMHQNQEVKMARAGLLWLLGIPIPILLLMWVLGWLS